MRRGIIYHCTTCKSRTEIDTDWNGRLVERLNHVCTCPPVVYQPEYEHGGQREAMLKKTNTCVDCGMPISRRAKRCPTHAADADRRRSSESHRQRRARQGAPITRYGEVTARAMYERRMRGETLVEIGKDYGVKDGTVSAWVARYVRSGAFELVGQGG